MVLKNHSFINTPFKLIQQILLITQEVLKNIKLSTLKFSPKDIIVFKCFSSLLFDYQLCVKFYCKILFTLSETSIYVGCTISHCEHYCIKRTMLLQIRWFSFPDILYHLNCDYSESLAPNNIHLIVPEHFNSLLILPSTLQVSSIVVDKCFVYISLYVHLPLQQ